MTESEKLLHNMLLPWVSIEYSKVTDEELKSNEDEANVVLRKMVADLPKLRELRKELKNYKHKNNK